MPRPSLRATVALAAAALLSGCHLGEGCTVEIRTEVRPTERTLAVHESFTPTVRATSCGGRKVLGGEGGYVWTTPDPSIVEVDGRTGRTTALRAGATRVIVGYAGSGVAAGAVAVTVR